MAKKMLIDATHDEEVRVAIVDGNRLEEFDSETSTKRQIKGNIYLAKVVRIEPSLQAAFVEFGGNRHGFLPFGEIHPDYFRIPVSDRPDSETAAKPVEETAETPSEKRNSRRKTKKEESASKAEEADVSSDTLSEAVDPEDGDIGIVDEDELPRRSRNYHYKIQEVIKRRQIMLVQVVKEERGNKGAALTTYLSLPGRYCVLMPNAGHRGGGISRKINDGTDRRRLRDILKNLEIPDGMSLIVRTAGQERNKLEIRRDFDYLIRLWEEIREKTLQSIAPALIYAEGDLIKRSIRDVYNREIDQILVEGDEAYKAAKAFMKDLIPSHTKKVQPYKDIIPLFHRYKVGEQIDAMLNPTAKLPSGGSIVINVTEALVAIDVNSGQATKERHIDETALKTNLEAADEVARQMRLRDLAGLVVIDFIDMSEQKHIHAVEKRLKEALSHDRARTQLGHISQFGLLEMSRQRLRPSLIETNSSPCHHCRGTGLVRSVESMSLLVLRAIESEGIAGRSAEMIAMVPAGVDLYLLNQKRSSLNAVENRYEMRVSIGRDESLVAPDFRIERLLERKPSQKLIQPQLSLPVEEEEQDPQNPDTEAEKEQGLPDDRPQEGTTSGRRRRRRRRHKRQDQEQNQEHIPQNHSSDEEKASQRSRSAEEQIITEIMESSSPIQDEASRKKGQEEPNTQGEENSPRRGRSHRNRRHHRDQRHSRQQNKDDSKSPSSVVSFPDAPTPGKDTAKPQELPSKPKDISVPVAVLPEGIEPSSQKNAQNRWWKRLLES